MVCLEYVNKAESNKKFKQNGLRTFRLWMDSEKNSMINGIDIESAFDQRFPRWLQYPCVSGLLPGNGKAECASLRLFALKPDAPTV